MALPIFNFSWWMLSERMSMVIPEMPQGNNNDEDEESNARQPLEK
jgi:uncharacterized membrane protein